MKNILNRSACRRYLPEMMIYIAIWGIVLLFPVVNRFFNYLSDKDAGMDWVEIGAAWLDVLPFLLLFVVNNRLLVPRLFLRKRITGYVLSTVLCVLFTFAMVELFSPTYLPGKPRAGMGRQMPVGQMPERRTPEQRMPPVQAEGRPFSPGKFRPHARPLFNVFLFRAPFIGRVLIALLMLSFNIAVKLFFKSLRDDEAMKELEHNKLQSELAYLKYQINPHFFMNTLNNIHALVDIDTEKAKQTIVELSRLMRYVLYESDQCTISLEKEVQFLRHYIELMRIRYPGSMHINLSLPEDETEVQVPPLLFISFVENAFKHGVSYRRESFVSISLNREGEELLFHCSNSCFGKNGDRHHGIGLANIRKRLQLLFGDKFSLVISDMEQRFDVLLKVPVGMEMQGSIKQLREQT